MMKQNYKLDRQLNRQANIATPFGIDKDLDALGILPVEQDKGMDILLREKIYPKLNMMLFTITQCHYKESGQGYLKIISA